MTCDEGDGGGTTAATERLVSAAAGLAGTPAPAADGDAFAEFVATYRDWIVAHHDLPGSREERVERTHLLLYAIAAADTLGAALALAVRFRRLIWGDRGFTLRREGAATMLVFDQPARAGVAGLVGDLWSLSFQLAECEFLVGGTLDGVAGRVRQPGGLPTPLAALLFDRPITYGHGELALIVPQRHLDRAVVARGAGVPDFLRRLVPRTVGAERRAPAVAAMVAALLRAGRLHDDDPPDGLEAMAGRLGISAATLRRRLAGEGVTFRAVRDGVFDDLAHGWLIDGHAIETIAARLGYSDAFAFRRAFRRRHGCSPSAYRRQARND